MAHHRAGHLHEARQLYAAVLQKDPKHIAAMNNLAILLDGETGIALLRRALAIEPGYVDALNNLALMLDKTYEGVTRRQCSFAAFQRGLDLLLQGGLPVRLKAMAMRANVHELPKIAAFCRERTRDYFRFDPFLHLRFDGDPRRNAEIKAQRLAPEEIAALERADPERWVALKKECDKLAVEAPDQQPCGHLFQCGAGLGSFVVSAEGYFRLCSSLWHPDCIYDLRQGSLIQAWEDFVMQVRERQSQAPEYLEKCSRCQLDNLCLWCPAHAQGRPPC